MCSAVGFSRGSVHNPLRGRPVGRLDPWLRMLHPAQPFSHSAQGNHIVRWAIICLLETPCRASFCGLYLSAHDKLLILGPLKNTYARGWHEIDICTRLQGVRTRDKAAVIALRRNLLFSSSLSLTPPIIATVITGLLSSTLPFLSPKCLNWKPCGPWGHVLLHNQRYLGWVCCGWKGYSCFLWR